VPETVTPSLWFDTQAEDAARFYTSVFKSSFRINCEDQEEVDYYWERLTDGGEEGRYGWLKGRFGLSWQVGPAALEEARADPDPERARGATQAMLQMKRLDIAALRDAADAVTAG
jgi:predicted 3-demethylubiquinone-9 3-methyltransferase (glyoxalase superfamily)